MDLRLLRLQSNPPYKYCLGSLYIRKGDVWEWECFAREPKVRSDVFISGETALPLGLYAVSLQPSHIFGLDVPLLVGPQLLAHGGARQAMGMRILPGHDIWDIETGILLGQTQGPRDLHHTKAAYEAVLEQIKLAVRCGEAVELEIAK